MTWTVRRGYLDLLGNIKLWAAASGITGPSMYDAVFSSRYTGWPYLRNLYVISLKVFALQSVYLSTLRFRTLTAKRFVQSN